MILVIGHDGFVGKRVMKRLKGAKKFKGDIRDYKNCLKQTKNADIVLHMAAVLDEQSPDLFEVNVIGTDNVVKACKENKVKKLVYLSTSGVCALSDTPFDEKSKYAPETPYERSKQMAEMIVRGFKNHVIIRSALVLGTNRYWVGITKQSKKPLISSGNFQWQTIYVEDLAEVIEMLIFKKGVLGETFVVANDENVSLRDIYEEIRKNLGLGKGSSVPMLFGQIYAINESFKKHPSIIPEHITRLVRERKYDITKIRNIGWAPKTGYKEGIKLMIEEFKKKKMI